MVTESRDLAEKAQACAAMKGQRLHGTGSLQTLQSARLQIFTNKMDGHQFGLRSCDECAQICFHSGSYSLASRRAMALMTLAARLSLGLPAWRRKRIRHSLTDGTQCHKTRMNEYAGK